MYNPIILQLKYRF